MEDHTEPLDETAPLPTGAELFAPVDEREAPDEPIKPKPASWNSVES